MSQCITWHVSFMCNKPRKICLITYLASLSQRRPPLRLRNYSRSPSEHISMNRYSLSLRSMYLISLTIFGCEGIYLNTSISLSMDSLFRSVSTLCTLQATSLPLESLARYTSPYAPFPISLYSIYSSTYFITSFVELTKFQN
jgi:hypothetical protein